MTELSDNEILTLFNQQESKNYAFGLLVRKYQERLYWVARRMVISHDDADDIVQNVFIRVWKNLHNFRGECQLFSWMYRIAVNETITFLKSKRNFLFIPLIDVESKLASHFQEDVENSADAIQLKLQKAILSLPEKQRLVFNLRYYDEITYEEMSEILQTSVGALKASFHHAVKKIEKFMNEH